MGSTLTSLCFIFNIFFLLIVVCRLCTVLSILGEMMFPIYKLWLHSLYGLHGPRCQLSPKMPFNLITHSPLYTLVIIEDISGVFSVAVCGRCSPGGPSRNLCCDGWWMGHHAATDTRRTRGTRTEHQPGLCYVNVQMWHWYHELWWVVASKLHNNYHIIGCVLCIMCV